MYSSEKSYNLLELTNILSLLADEATVSVAKQKANSLRPFGSFEEATLELNKTDEAFILSAKYASPSFGSPADPAPLLTRVEVGGVLTMSELLDIGNVLRVIRSVKEWRDNISDTAVNFLEEYFSVLTPNKFLEELITSTIKSSEEMFDNASPELASIRRKLRQASSSIRDRLDAIVKNHQKSKYLQEAIVTQRDGRYVVPVRAEYKNEISGIVHDTSASGATLFIEPISVVEANNELRVLLSSEKEEIDRILYELSVKVSEFAQSISASFEAVAELNLIFAKSSLAYKMRATMPILNNSGRIVLKNARHPLIDKKSVVPITVSLGVDFNQLIITGPNTGGKTVTLKTVGLLTAMALSGMMIPADDKSEISFFERILVDIGDDQSIEQSLSTFSSHMVNLVDIIEESKKPSLVLLDEIGAGTDPVEGSALAKAILIKLNDNGARVIATTHYTELKNYAATSDGIENASCEFDIKTLKPTYKLLVGVPGKSNAFIISSKLGIEDNIIEMAKSFVSDENVKIDKLTLALETARQEAEEEKKTLEKRSKEAEDRLNLAEKTLREAEAEKEKILEKAKNDASYIIDNTRYNSNRLLGELEELKKHFNAENATAIYGQAKRQSNQTLDNLQNESDPVSKKKEDDYSLPRELEVGDAVLLFDINKDALVEQISKDKARAFVSVGAIKTWTDISNIRLKEKPSLTSAKKTRSVTGVASKAERDVRYEFDMRGMTVDEGIMELDRYIDGAVMAGYPSVTVIHGKGTGALRKAVQTYLKSNKAVKTFRLGVFGEGESGVTIVELK